MKKIKYPKFNFNLRKDSRNNAKNEQAILLVFRVNNQRNITGTGLKVLPKNWNSRAQRVKINDRNSTLLNEALESLQANLKQAWLLFVKQYQYAPSIEQAKELVNEVLQPIEQETPTIDKKVLQVIQDYIKDLESGKKLVKVGKNKGKKQSINTIKQTIGMYNLIKKWSECHNEDLQVKEFNTSDFYNSFRDYCFDILNYNASTFSIHITKIKGFLLDHDITPNKAFMRINSESDNVALTEQQIHTLEALDLSKNPTQQDIRDAFLINCYTALRFSDVQNLSKENYKNGLLFVKQIKTGNSIAIAPLKGFAELMQKRGWVFPKSYSPSFFNTEIKKICDMAGLTDKTKKEVQKGKHTETIEKPLNELITSHTGRRTYATITYKKGIPFDLIKSATGHQSQEMLERYIKVTDTEKALRLKSIQQEKGI